MSTRQIVIEGDRVRVQDVAALYDAPLTSLMDRLAVKVPVSSPILPRNVIATYVNEQARHGTFLVLMQPKRVRLHIVSGDFEAFEDSERDDHAWRVAVPYTLFAYHFTYTPNNARTFAISHSSAWWLPSEPTAGTDPVWNACLPNVDDGGWICWGYQQLEHGTLAQRVNELTNSFYTSDANLDLGENIPPAYSSFTEWEQASEENPDCWRSWDSWGNPPISRTISSLLTSYWQDEGEDTDAAIVLDASAPAQNTELPQPPIVASIGRLREWFAEQTTSTQNRLLTAFRGLDRP